LHCKRCDATQQAHEHARAATHAARDALWRIGFDFVCGDVEDGRTVALCQK